MVCDLPICNPSKIRYIVADFFSTLRLGIYEMDVRQIRFLKPAVNFRIGMLPLVGGGISIKGVTITSVQKLL
jgi:hypothetical protein